MPLPNLSRLLITVPLIGLVMNPAAASGVAAEEAVRILSKARTADQRCKILSPAERSELSRYTARAEIAAANQASPKAAKAAAASGTTQGQSGACSPDLEADVRETLDAARAAVAAAGPAKPKVAAATPPAKSKRKAEATGKPRHMSGGGLERYARLVKAYYLERHCRSLPKHQAAAFWKGIVRLHKQVVASNGAPAVAPVMRAAERQAGGSSCGGKAKAIILSGHDEITGG